MKKITYYFSFVLVCALVFISCEDEQLTGEFFSTPDGSDPEEFCMNAPLAIVAAQATLASAPADQQEELCNVLIGTINSTINVCGDDGGILQALLDDLGDDCMIDSSNDGGVDGDGVFFITFKANGELVDLEYNSDGPTSDFLPVNSISGNGNCDRDYGPGLVPNSDDIVPQAGLDFINLLSIGDCLNNSEEDLFNTSFPVGSYVYTTDESSYGVGFSYSPNEDDYFRSIEGTQTSSSFEIVTSQESNILVNGGLFRARQIITGTFSCTIFKEGDPTQSITITDGSFRLAPESFF